MPGLCTALNVEGFRQRLQLGDFDRVEIPGCLCHVHCDGSLDLSFILGLKLQM